MAAAMATTAIATIRVPVPEADPPIPDPRKCQSPSA
jgi:hypothetical protein